MKIKDLVKMPDKSNGVCVCDCIPCKTGFCDDCSLGNTEGYKSNQLCYEYCCCDDTRNNLIDEIGSMEVKVDRNKLKLFLADWCIKEGLSDLPIRGLTDDLITALPSLMEGK